MIKWAGFIVTLAVLLFLCFAVAGVNLVIAAVAGAVFVALVIMRPLWGLGLTILTNVLSPLLGQFDFSGLGLTLPRVTGAITAVSWLLVLIVRRERFPVRGHMAPLAGFLAAVVLSCLSKPDRSLSTLGVYLVFVGVLMYMFVATLPFTRRELTLVVAMVWGIGLVSSGVGFTQYVFPQFTILQNTEGGLDFGEGAIVDADSVGSGPIRRVTGGLGDPNNMAATLVSILPLAVFWWFLPSAQGLRWMVVAITALQLGGLTLTYSRAGLMGLATAIGVLTWKRMLPVRVVLPVGAAMVIAAIALLPGFSERMFSIGYLKEGSTNIRKDIYMETLQIIGENWLTGIGYGQLGPLVYGNPRSEHAELIAGQIDLDSPEVYNLGAHNLVLEVWVEYGIIGLLPYLLFVGMLLREINQMTRSPDQFTRSLSICLLAGLSAFLVCGIFSHGKSLKVFWLIAGLAVAAHTAAIRLNANRDEVEAQPAADVRSGAAPRV